MSNFSKAVCLYYNLYQNTDSYPLTIVYSQPTQYQKCSHNPTIFQPFVRFPPTKKKDQKQHSKILHLVLNPYISSLLTAIPILLLTSIPPSHLYSRCPNPRPIHFVYYMWGRFSPLTQEILLKYSLDLPYTNLEIIYFSSSLKPSSLHITCYP